MRKSTLSKSKWSAEDQNSSLEAWSVLKQLFELSEDFKFCKAELSETHESVQRQITVSLNGTEGDTWWDETPETITVRSKNTVSSSAFSTLTIKWSTQAISLALSGVIVRLWYLLVYLISRGEKISQVSSEDSYLQSLCLGSVQVELSKASSYKPGIEQKCSHQVHLISMQRLYKRKIGNLTKANKMNGR